MIGEKAKGAGMLVTVLWSEEYTVAVPGDMFTPVGIPRLLPPVSYSFTASAETICPAVFPDAED